MVTHLLGGPLSEPIVGDDDRAVVSVGQQVLGGILSRVESKPASEDRIKTSQSEAWWFISFLRFGANGLAAS